MVKINCAGALYKNRSLVSGAPSDEARKKTIAYKILSAHNTSGDMKKLRLKFDAMASHDITYVGIIQTARASGLKEFPLPYVLTNCHNSLCAVGGTINEDDHIFGLSAAHKYGGEFVPAHQAVIHQYMRERYAGCGKMILASDSHTRYGAIGTLSVGEGGPELVKQLLSKTYDIAYPEIVGVELIGKPRAGVGPQDVALAIIGATFKDGVVKNRIMEFVGEGISNLSMDFRNGIDVMTTETSCLSSIWMTDEVTRAFLKTHGREEEYRELKPDEDAYYDVAVTVDLSKIEPMIALPFHPSNTYTIRELKANLTDILSMVDKNSEARGQSLLGKVRGGELYVDQGFIGGCSGGLYQNILRTSEILGDSAIGNGNFWLSVYPASQPMMLELARKGILTRLMENGASIRTAFCGPCFGAGDVPGNGALSVRHATRNFPNREGSKPTDGQVSFTALMDARSIAATAKNQGRLTSAFEIEAPEDSIYEDYSYDDAPYKSRVYFGVGKPEKSGELKFGPNIADWPKMPAMPESLTFEIASAIFDPVTTTDELIPSGETSSYRSNPMRLASFALSRKDPEYVEKTRKISERGIGSAIFAIKPGDGSAREQAASCQRVLGGVANIANEYATKRYRSNVVNWGMLPFISDDRDFLAGDVITVKAMASALRGNDEVVSATLERNGSTREIKLRLPALTREERDIILAGCLINYYAKTQK